MKARLIIACFACCVGLVTPRTLLAEEGSSSSISPEAQEELHRQAQVLFDRIKRQGPRFNLIGEVEAGKGSAYSINGEDFDIGPNARVYGELMVGQQASVFGDIVGGKKQARLIQVGSGSGDGQAPSGQALQ